MRHGEIANVPGQDERRQQAGKKQPQTDQGQLRHLDTGDYSHRTYPLSMQRDVGYHK